MPVRAADPSTSAGFTLIEVVVALVILSTILLAFYEFLSSALVSGDRARTAVASYDRGQNALALVTTLNPMDAPEGSFDLGSYRIRWRAQRIGAARQSSGYPSGRGRFTVALYRVVLDVPDDPKFPPLEVTKLGYHLLDLPGNPSAEQAN
jgi:prepilin-type N-terminal cleavage/methylation domain-containing protein